VNDVKKIKVTSKGQVTLPLLLRKQLEIQDGDYLEVVVENNGLFLKPLPRENFQEQVREYCLNHQYGSDADLKQTRKTLSKVPFSISEQVGKLREEEL
jgi:AbrB family looped-hinge helix DNA binding protein